MNDDAYMYDPDMMPSYQMPQTLQLFNPEEGLTKGTLFNDLYKPYIQGNFLNSNVINSEKEAMLRQIQAVHFSLIDMDLYLDTHPNDRQIIELYNQNNNELKQMTSMFEQEYGPLDLSSSTLQKYPWAWIPGPWPWEKEAN